MAWLGTVQRALGYQEAHSTPCNGDAEQGNVLQAQIRQVHTQVQPAREPTYATAASHPLSGSRSRHLLNLSRHFMSVGSRVSTLQRPHPSANFNEATAAPELGGAPRPPTRPWLLPASPPRSVRCGAPLQHLREALRCVLEAFLRRRVLPTTAQIWRMNAADLLQEASSGRSTTRLRAACSSRILLICWPNCHSTAGNQTPSSLLQLRVSCSFPLQGNRRFLASRRTGHDPPQASSRWSGRCVISASDPERRGGAGPLLTLPGAALASPRTAASQCFRQGIEWPNGHRSMCGRTESDAKSLRAACENAGG